MKTTATLVSVGATILLAAPARAQFDLSWNVIACGGGQSSAGTFDLGASIGQSDAGIMSGGAFQLAGGFWPAGGASCYANCDGSTSPPLLTVNDFVCFQSRFAAGDPYANCDGSTTVPLLTVNDFVCFQSRFAAGCP
jgi:hypothetical protein